MEARRTEIAQKMWLDKFHRAMNSKEVIKFFLVTGSEAIVTAEQHADLPIEKIDDTEFDCRIHTPNDRWD
jgi:hypothetical protein